MRFPLMGVAVGLMASKILRLSTILGYWKSHNVSDEIVRLLPYPRTMDLQKAYTLNQILMKISSLKSKCPPRHAIWRGKKHKLHILRV